MLASWYTLTQLKVMADCLSTTQFLKMTQFIGVTKAPAQTVTTPMVE